MKKLLSFLITLIMFVIIVILSLSFCFKKIIVKNISNEVVKESISNKITDYSKEKFSNIDNNTIEKIKNKLMDSKSIDSITQKYVDASIDVILHDKDVIVPNTKDELNKLLDENKEILNEYNITITEEEKDKLINEIDSSNIISDSYVEIVTSARNSLSDEQVNLIKLIDKILSRKFRIMLFITYIVLVILLCIIKKSYYKWIKNVSKSLIAAFIFLSLLVPLLVNSLLYNSYNYFTRYGISINIDLLVNLGFYYLIIGIVLYIVYLIVNKIIKKKEI